MRVVLAIEIFHIFKSSNLPKETDDRSLVSANDCLLMFQANSRLRLHVRQRNSLQFLVCLCVNIKAFMHVRLENAMCLVARMYHIVVLRI